MKMLRTYQIKENDKGQTYLEMTEQDGTIKFVPTDPANSDYAEYLESLNDDTETE